MLLEELLKSGWTYAAIATEMGVHWHTIKRWHSGDSRVSKAAAIGLSTLREKSPPPKRRYSPDAPQRHPKKHLTGG
jgi:plasmid maintenance system antidote protein VapI